MTGPTTYLDESHLEHLDPATRDLVERRHRALGSAYRLFYSEPIRFVRGLGTKLYDDTGTEYLDAYNNVPSVGHAHPRVAAAMASQAALLTTHTRYLSDGIVDYAEQVLATLPDDISNMMFTCTGSEANDLALRIAKLATGGQGVVVTTNAYHGVTTEIAAISPSLGGALSIAPWVRLVAAPDPYREPDVAARLARDVSDAFAELAAAGFAPAAFIVDTIFASDGVQPGTHSLGTPGFLAPAAEAARAAGALVIADEVQPGFGRLGHGLWGFDRHLITPDIVTVGKPMGNGQPVAAVMARRDLVDAFGARSRYFNTFGGSSVSIAAAQATFDVLRDEGLVENARVVGSYLGAALDELATRHSTIGDIRGAGLFIGVELVTDRDSRTPDADLALDVVNGLRDRRVLLSASGVANNVLKIRPPLPFSTADADRLVTELDAVLGETPARQA